MRRTQREIASKAGIAESALSQYLNDKRRPSWDTAKKLESVTGIPAVDWLEMPGEEIRAKITGTEVNVEKAHG